MLDFRKPVVGDRQWVEKIFRDSGSRGCEYSFATLFLWSDIYRQQVAEFEGDVLERLSGARGPAYLFPAGGAPLRQTLEALAQDAAQRGQSCRLACVTPEQKEQVEAAWPERFQWELDRDGFDYVYEIGRLAELPGKKLQGKRNHINRFLENCPDWTTEEITEKTLPECAEMDREWNRLCRGRMISPADQDLERRRKRNEEFFKPTGPIQYSLGDRFKMWYHRHTGRGALPDIAEGTPAERYLSERELAQLHSPMLDSVEDVPLPPDLQKTGTLVNPSLAQTLKPVKTGFSPDPSLAQTLVPQGPKTVKTGFSPDPSLLQTLVPQPPELRKTGYAQDPSLARTLVPQAQPGKRAKRKSH